MKSMKSAGQVKTGLNRTGAQLSPIHTRALEEAARTSTPTSAGDESAITIERVRTIRDMDSSVGTVPAPGTIKGVTNTVLKKVSGKHPEILIDKLGERLAFERTGVRLYEALIAKCEALDGDAQGIPIQSLAQFRMEELRHFRVISDALSALGADPTAQTPSADIAVLHSSGLIQSLTDPRATLLHALDAILIAELADNEGWLLLIRLTDAMGRADLTEDFRSALQEEEEHLAHVRRWSRHLLMEAGNVKAA